LWTSTPDHLPDGVTPGPGTTLSFKPTLIDFTLDFYVQAVLTSSYGGCGAG
jgi:hypothetical protein